MAMQVRVKWIATTARAVRISQSKKKEVHFVADAVGQDEVHGNRYFCMIHAFSAPIVVCIVQELDCGMRAFACRVKKPANVMCALQQRVMTRTRYLRKGEGNWSTYSSMHTFAKDIIPITFLKAFPNTASASRGRTWDCAHRARQ